MPTIGASADFRGLTEPNLELVVREFNIQFAQVLPSYDINIIGAKKLDRDISFRKYTPFLFKALF